MASEVNTSRNQSPSDPPRSDARRYLRDEELDHGIGLIFAGERRLSRAIEDARLAAKLSRTELQALLTIRYEPGLDVKQLQTRLVTSVPTCARILASLDGRELITRETPHSDRRRRELSLSEDGMALTGPIAEILRDTLRTAYRAAGAEQVMGARALLEALIRDE